MERGDEFFAWRSEKLPEIVLKLQASSLIAEGDKNIIIVQTRFINVVKCVKSLKREFKYC